MKSRRRKGKIVADATAVSGSALREGPPTAFASATAAARRLLALAMADAARCHGRSDGGAGFRKGSRLRRPYPPGADLPEIESATAAVMLGAALSVVPDLIDRLLDGQPIVVIEVPGSDWIEPLACVARTCFGPKIAPEDLVPEPLSFDDPESKHASLAGAAVVAAKGARPDVVAERAVGRALAELRPIIGIAASPRTELPEDMLRACDHWIVIGPFDGELLSLVVEAATGARTTGTLPPDLLRLVEFADLRLAVNASRGADGSVERLNTILRRRAGRNTEAPRLRDLRGYGTARTWGMETAADLSSFARGELPWSEVDRGVVLWGPPGTGKTLFAQALAREARVPLIAGSLARWQSAGEAHLGTTLKAMRHFFERARRMSPSIALLDELDSFGSRDEFADYNRHYATQIVNGLLECLDGFDGREGVVLVGTTNAIDRIDPAILRSGRFDRRIHVGLPSAAELAGILRHHLGHELEEADLIEAGRQGVGGTGADCAAWVRRASGRARRDQRRMSLADLLAEIGSARLTDPTLAWRIAVHESGHAVVADVCGIRATEIVLGGRSPRASGQVEHDAGGGPVTTSFCRRLLRMAMGGRAAEVLLLGEASAGAADDLLKATELAEAMIGRWGLGGRLSTRPTSDLLDRSVEYELQQAFHDALSILAGRRDSLHALAMRLVERGQLDAAEVAALVARDPPPDTRRADGEARDRTADLAGHAGTGASGTRCPGAPEGPRTEQSSASGPGVFDHRASTEQEFAAVPGGALLDVGRTAASRDVGDA